MTTASPAAELASRAAGLDWNRINAELDEFGFATIGPFLALAECARLAGAYDHEDLFRSTIVMQRHGFGSGAYRYFRYPLPEPVAALRECFYAPLAAIANRWSAELGTAETYEEDHAAFLRRCHAAGQTRPTPLLLRYEAGDYNCLHQDVYGEHVFPLQAAFLLSQPGEDFGGGEFVLTEQRPRMQSRAHVVPLQRGEGVIFAVRQRPAQGRRGAYRVTMRHGVSRLSFGLRFTLGVIFHDAL